MKIKIFALTLFLVLSNCIIAQQPIISGKIIDKGDSKPIEYANITLMASDSSLIKGVNSDVDGKFTLINIEQGDYLIFVTFIGYESTLIPIRKNEDDLDIGDIYLDPSSIALQDVTVTGHSIINKLDRKLIMPTDAQIKASANGIELLQKMQLPRLTFDFINNKVALAGNGELQLRINGVEVTNSEIVALRPEDIIRIEYHDQPGARYGNAEAVLDYIVRRRESGGNINGNGMNVIAKSVFSDNFLSAKFNHRKSEFSTNIYASNRNFDWTRKNDEIFRFSDKELERVEDGLPTKFKQNVINTTINYSLLDKDNYYFNARFRYNFNEEPNAYTDRKSTLVTSDNPIPLNIYDHQSLKNNIPALDLYFQKNLKNNQLLIFNVVGTYITSSSSRLYQEHRENIPVTDILSKISGDRYSLITEGIYEKNFDKSKLTGGLKYSQSYTHNKYSGNTIADVGMNTSEIYGYAEYLWKRGKFSYTANIGVMRTYYRQGDEQQNKYTFRPSFSTAYNINDFTFVRARAYIWGGNPSLGDLNNVEQAVDSLQIRRGNPNLKSYLDYGANLTFGYNKGILGVDLNAGYKYLRKPVMESIFLENGKFIKMPENQKSYQRLNVESTFKIRPLKDHLTIGITPGINYYRSYGNNYKHNYTNPYMRINIDVMYKNWIMNFWATTANNWFYGESMYQGEAFHMASVGYNKPSYSVMVGAMNPLGTDYKTRNESWSNLYSSKSQLTGYDLTPLLFVKFSFNINFGRQFNGNGRRINNADTDAGIMSGAKK